MWINLFVLSLSVVCNYYFLFSALSAVMCLLFLQKVLNRNIAKKCLKIIEKKSCHLLLISHPFEQSLLYGPSTKKQNKICPVWQLTSDLNLARATSLWLHCRQVHANPNLHIARVGLKTHLLWQMSSKLNCIHRFVCQANNHLKNIVKTYYYCQNVFVILIEKCKRDLF